MIRIVEDEDHPSEQGEIGLVDHMRTDSNGLRRDVLVLEALILEERSDVRVPGDYPQYDRRMMNRITLAERRVSRIRVDTHLWGKRVKADIGHGGLLVVIGGWWSESLSCCQIDSTSANRRTGI